MRRYFDNPHVPALKVGNQQGVEPMATGTRFRKVRFVEGSRLRQTALRELLRRHIISLLPSRPARSLPERALAGCAPLVPRRVLALPATSPDRSRLRAVVVLAARASAAATADCRGRERRQAQEQQAAHALQGERAPALSSGLSCHLNPCSSLVSLRRSFRRSMSTHAALLPH